MTTAGVALGLTGSAFSLSGKNVPRENNRVGIIGLDTSHSVAFTKTLNDPKAAPEFGGYKVVAAYPKGSKDIESSIKRIPGYTEEVQKYNVKIVDSIKKLLNEVDVVLLETNDGRLHLEQALQVFKAGKPTFIDKPIAASLADTMAIFEAAKKYKVPVFSASSLRYMTGAQEVVQGKIGKVLGAEAFSPMHLESTHPDLVWYGIHGVETLLYRYGYRLQKCGAGTYTRYRCSGGYLGRRPDWNFPGSAQRQTRLWRDGFRRKRQRHFRPLQGLQPLTGANS